MPRDDPIGQHACPEACGQRHADEHRVAHGSGMKRKGAPKPQWRKDSLGPYARAFRHARDYRALRLRAALPLPSAKPKRLAFIVGCGRSGTTILGNLLKLHPDVEYLFEPYDRWAAVDARTDIAHLFCTTESRCFLEAPDCNAQIRTRFTRPFPSPLEPSHCLVEKSPMNTFAGAQPKRFGAGLAIYPYCSEWRECGRLYCPLR
jgi:hypothetical protein